MRYIAKSCKSDWFKYSHMTVNRKIFNIFFYRSTTIYMMIYHSMMYHAILLMI